MTNEITKEPKLLWLGKEREADILADTMSLPFQEVKRFGKAKEGEWVNKLIFGDNLPALKYLLKLKKEGKLRNPDGSDGVKLVFIDPPFGTGDVYDAKGDAPAYSAALIGVEYIESLRRRLILLRELLTEDGSIYLKIDYHYGHYVKVIMDEVFDKNNFLSEIIISKFKKPSKTYSTTTESIFFYSNNSNLINKTSRKRICQFCKNPLAPVWRDMSSPGQGEPRYFYINNKKVLLCPQKGRHWPSQETIDERTKLGQVKFNNERSFVDTKGKNYDFFPETLQSENQELDTNWTDVLGYAYGTEYPTEIAEEILYRIINSSSNLNDIVLDCFAGSGTTGAVAEKLGRKWIMCDMGKLSLYTMQKRLLNLKEEIGNKGKPLKAKPFVVYNAGLYDYNLIEKLGDEEYKNFVLDLFQVDKQSLKINGLEFQGKLFGNPVKVFDRKGFLTEDYVKDLHETVGNSISDCVFIIAPATNVEFISTAVEFDGKRYYILKVPYSIIDELHSKPFKRLIQPDSASKINEIVDSIGFDFIYPPEIKRELSVQKRGGLFPNEKDCVIHIKSVNPIQITNKPVEFKNELDALAGVFIDYNYDGETFNLDKAYFADEVFEKGDAFKVHLEVEKLGDKICVIYLDKLGNEKIEAIKKSEFEKKK
jgi:site-specific DNA-methyltransferase (adenine-specific)/adenine-specific DNA-methyltransferase